MQFLSSLSVRCKWTHIKIWIEAMPFYYIWKICLFSYKIITQMKHRWFLPTECICQRLQARPDCRPAWGQEGDVGGHPRDVDIQSAPVLSDLIHLQNAPGCSFSNQMFIHTIYIFSFLSYSVHNKSLTRSLLCKINGFLIMCVHCAKNANSTEVFLADLTAHQHRWR